MRSLAPASVGFVARFAVGTLCVLCGLSTPRIAGARVLVTVDEALALAFPGATIARDTVYLKPEQIERARTLAGGEASPPAIVRPYRATKEGALVGTAYFDVHVVRTLEETVMVVVRPDSTVGRVETISFDEPPDYLPRDAWYRQFDGRALDPELELRRAIRPVTGATLTARATTDAVRRVLALHQVVAEDAARQGVPSRPAAAEEPNE